jgi:hypothetical protein
VGLEYAITVVTCCSSCVEQLSGGDVVLVDEAAEDLFSADPVLGEVDLLWPDVRLSRRQLREGAVRPGCVVVGQYSVSTWRRWCSLMMSIRSSSSRRSVPIIRSQTAFRPRRPRRASENPDTRRCEHGVKGISELSRTIPDQELGTSDVMAEVHQEVTRCLSRPRAARVRGDARQVSAADAVLDDDQGVDAAQQHGVHVDEVGREDAAGLRGQELLPRRAGPGLALDRSRRRAGSATPSRPRAGAS